MFTLAPLLALLLSADPGPRTAPAEAVSGWSAPPFSLEPAQLLALAARARVALVKDGREPPELLLWNSVEYEVVGDRVLTRCHVVHLALTEDGAKTAGTLWTQYQPERSTRPRIEARIIPPKGPPRLYKSTQIDMLTAVPGARLAVVPGSLVEIFDERQEKVPLLPGGASAYTFLQGDVWATRVKVVAPATSPLRGVAWGVAGVREQRRKVGQQTELEWTAGPQRFGDPEALPGPEARVPSIAWTTWKSWKEISARLAAAIEPRIRPADVAAVAKTVAGDATQPEEVAARLFEFATTKLKFERGTVADHGLVPDLTGDTLKAGSAGSRDQAAVLVAALRARGLQADLALVQWLFRMTDALPTLDSFDTPLVLVTGPGLKAPLWLDVMYGKGPNDVTVELGGKSALPIRPAGSELMLLPPSTRGR